MNRAFLLALALTGFSRLAYADIPAHQADCAFFEDRDQMGAYWTSQIAVKDPSSPTLTDWWQERASSVWVREGFVLEAYRDVRFVGARIDLSAETPNAAGSDGGYAINLEDLGWNDQLSSYRCRPAGEQKSLLRGEVFWQEGGSYNWQSGGNHPNHKSLSMKTEGDGLIVLVHADDTYGINRQDFRINLSTNHVHVDFAGNAAAKGEADFDLLLATMRPDFRLILQELVGDIRTIAKGYSPFPSFIEPPKPELLSLADYLQGFVP